MDTGGAASPRDSGERRDHLDIFREFLDHLERAARRGVAATAKDKRSRTNAG